MGSIMLEENVVSAAGAPHRFTSESIEQCIKKAGFTPQLISITPLSGTMTNLNLMSCLLLLILPIVIFRAGIKERVM